jgi:hypothetical protein
MCRFTFFFGTANGLALPPNTLRKLQKYDKVYQEEINLQVMADAKGYSV